MHLINLKLYDYKNRLIKTIEVESHKKKRFYDDILSKHFIEGATSYKLSFKNESKTTTKLNDRIFTQLLEFDGKSITLATTDIDADGFYGTYSTTFPISDLSYRKEHKLSNAWVDVDRSYKGFIFRIVDDHGTASSLYAPNEVIDILKVASDYFQEQELYTNSHDFTNTIKSKTLYGGHDVKYYIHIKVLGNGRSVTSVRKLILWDITTFEYLDGITDAKVLKRFKDQVLCEQYLPMLTEDLVLMGLGINNAKNITTIINELNKK